VVHDMNLHFSSVAQQMHEVRGHMVNMEKRVALLEDIKQMTGVMDEEMKGVDADMSLMRRTLAGIDLHVAKVRNNVGNISVNMDIMNNEVQSMSGEMFQMAKPARSMNKIFPFP